FLLAIGVVGDRPHLLVIGIRAAPVGLELDVVDGAVLALLEHDSADPLTAVARRDDGDHEPEVLAEVRREPPVPPRGLPEAGAPRVVTQTEPVDGPLLVADAHGASGADVLL